MREQAINMLIEVNPGVKKDTEVCNVIITQSIGVSDGVGKSQLVCLSGKGNESVLLALIVVRFAVNQF